MIHQYLTTQQNKNVEQLPNIIFVTKTKAIIRENQVTKKPLHNKPPFENLEQKNYGSF